MRADLASNPERDLLPLRRRLASAISRRAQGHVGDTKEWLVFRHDEECVAAAAVEWATFILNRGIINDAVGVIDKRGVSISIVFPVRCVPLVRNGCRHQRPVAANCSKRKRFAPPHKTLSRGRVGWEHPRSGTVARFDSEGDERS